MTFISTELMLVAQRGRVRPEDYMDYPDYGHSSSDGSPILYIILLIVMGVGILCFKATLNSSRKEEIRKKTIFVTNGNIFGFPSGYCAKTDPAKNWIPEKFFVEEKGKVGIPKYSKCIILEYYPEDHSFVKVKFENYSKPLYIGRWHLRTPEQLSKEETR